MVKAGDNTQQPLAFITAISLTQHRDAACIKQIKRYLLSHCPKQHKPYMTALLNESSPSSSSPSDQNVGLLIHDRMINLPSQLVPPLHQALYDDIQWAMKNSSEGRFYSFTTMIMLSRCFVDQTQSQAQSKKKKKQKQRLSDAQFFKFEDQFYQQESSVVYSFSSPHHNDKSGSTHSLPQTRLVMVFPVEAIPKIVKLLEPLIS